VNKTRKEVIDDRFYISLHLLLRWAFMATLIASNWLSSFILRKLSDFGLGPSPEAGKELCPQ
jgi:hypothetical protein